MLINKENIYKTVKVMFLLRREIKLVALIRTLSFMRLVLCSRLNPLSFFAGVAIVGSSPLIPRSRVKTTEVTGGTEALGGVCCRSIETLLRTLHSSVRQMEDLLLSGG